MRRLLVVLISFILLLFMGATALASEFQTRNIVVDSEVQSLLNEVKQLGKQEENLQKQIVLKRKTLQYILKDTKIKERKEFRNSIEIMNNANTSIKEARAKENALWLDLNAAKKNNDITKMRSDLQGIMDCQKKSIIGMNKKLSVLNSLISVLGS